MATTKKPFVPPGGFAGFAQQTPATQALVRKKATRKKARKKLPRKKTTARRRPAKKRAKKTGKRLVKGSAAAKRRMAQLRKMRRKR